MTKKPVGLKDFKIEMVATDLLKPYPQNAKAHPAAQIDKIVRSLKEYGIAKNIVINADNEIICGHGSVLAYQKLGVGVVPCRRMTHLTPAQERGLRLADNRTAESEWFPETLALELQALSEMDFDLALTGFDLDELEGFGIGQCDLPPEDPGPQIDRAAELQVKWGTERGQIWSVGRHRVMCGDCLFADPLFDGQKYDLLVTDPPYGVSYAAKNEFLNAISRGNRIQTPIEGDSQTPEEMSAFWEGAFVATRSHAKPGAGYYVTGPQGGDLLLLLLLALKNSGFPLRHMLIWAKNNHVLGRSDYNYKHEPIIYGWVEGAGHKFYGGGGETSLWEVDKPLKSEFHPTMKPIELFARAIKNSSQENEIVYDPFLGSGTTLIAAEQLGRVCYGMEISEAYTAVVLERASGMGLEPKLIETIEPQGTSADHV